MPLGTIWKMVETIRKAVSKVAGSTPVLGQVRSTLAPGGKRSSKNWSQIVNKKNVRRTQVHLGTKMIQAMVNHQCQNQNWGDTKHGLESQIHNWHAAVKSWKSTSSSKRYLTRTYPNSKALIKPYSKESQETSSSKQTSRRSKPDLSRRTCSKSWLSTVCKLKRGS